MDGVWLLKHKNGKYYSDGEFLEPDKTLADRFRYGQAVSIKRRLEKYVFGEPQITIEKA